MKINYLLIIIFSIYANLVLSQKKYSKEVDDVSLNNFFSTHKAYVVYEEEVKELYKNNNSFFWYKENQISEFAVLMYNATCKIGEEGLPREIPYQKEIDNLFKVSKKMTPKKQNDILLTCLYYYYIDKVFKGLSIDKSIKTGWKIPRKRDDYITSLSLNSGSKEDFILQNQLLFNQYYQLKFALQKYSKIALAGGWDSIPHEIKEEVKPNDVCELIKTIRHRLFIEGYVMNDSKSKLYDKELENGIIMYQEHHGMIPNVSINDALLASLNVSVKERMECIAVNMERCRWINPKHEMNYIAVNIPSFMLFYFKNKDTIFSSKVVVGKEMNRTVVFSGILKQIIFNPYWNVPSSILKNEILPAIRKNPNYLKQHQMEWKNGKVRQKPGDNNALGRVKFIFPNSNNIYLHDTPQKALFNEEKRAFSHGCIRVEKACELAVILMHENYGWTEQQTIDAMQHNTQKMYTLLKQLPVYIVYFTAWADTSGNVFFFPDIYKRDKVLAEMIFEEVHEK